jgi:hypothetical protein
LRGGNGDIILKWNTWYTSYNNSYYLDAITGGDLKIEIENDRYANNFYIKNAIAGGNVRLDGSVSRFLSDSSTNYISAGTGKEIYIRAYEFGTNSSNAPGILANGAYLYFVFHNDDAWINGITGTNLINRIYLRKIVTDHYSTIHYSPYYVFN